MVKKITLTLDDNEFEELVKAKGKLTWKEFVFELLKFKKKVEHENEVIPKNALKKSYLEAAELLRNIGSLIKVVWYEENQRVALDKEYEVAALLPLFVAGKELTEEEKREFGLILVNTLGMLLETDEKIKELWPELRWVIQGLRMLVLEKKELYELSMDNFIEERSRRQGTSTD